MRRPSTSGFPSHLTGMLNGGILHGGAGVLSLPYAMAQFGWYHELGQYAFGEKLENQANIFHHDFRLSPLFSFPSPELQLHIRCLTGCCSHVIELLYHCLGASVAKGVQPNVHYSYKASSTSGKVFDFFTGLGEIAFAYAGHNVVFEIQATIPSTPEKPSKGPMLKANMFIVIHVIGSYQEGSYLRLVPGNHACLFPGFGASMYHLAHHMQTQKIQLNLICIILGVLLMVLSPIGGLQSIIVSAKDYQFFS
ncbi:hypothetical protein F3Y22_tig00003041pilonHSYRG00978 [Hibiscus syriacus]|uniref:Amino acid transporter transmembrane domain-containing protein n=1 Tax=Hibiscus syriacus TaxID=106335 RepID=A0A6A3CSG5_HIBSY|nr:hypothetical protein F3Y22_tig00003041pilonHSYRG00978 [Hibiscus syriacus]